MKTKVAIYPALPSGVRRSPYFRVTVSGQPVDTLVSTPPGPPDARLYPQYSDGNAFNSADGRSMSYACFSFSGCVDVTVEKTSGTCTAISARPSAGIGRDFDILETDTARRRITLRFRKPNAKVSVEFYDEDRSEVRDLPLHSVMVFADQDESKDKVRPPEKDSKGTYSVFPGQAIAIPDGMKAVRFEPGLHGLSYWSVPPAIEHVYLSGGAYLMGAVDGRFCPRLAITGRGIVSGERFPWRAGRTDPGISLSGDLWKDTIKLIELGPTYYLDGICAVNAPHWVLTFGSDESESKGTVFNFKVFGNWRWNNDGIAVTKDSRVTRCFVSAFDDAFKLYNSGGRVDNCVVWQMDNGAVFQFGWYPKNVKNVKVWNVDIIHAEWTGRNQNWGIVNMAQRDDIQGDERVIEDITFKDIRLEGPAAKTIGLNLYSMPGQKIRRMRIRNLSVGSVLDPSAYPFKARNADANSHGETAMPVFDVSKNVEGLTFDNFTIGGKRVEKGQGLDAGMTVIQAGSDVSFD